MRNIPFNRCLINFREVVINTSKMVRQVIHLFTSILCAMGNTTGLHPINRHAVFHSKYLADMSTFQHLANIPSCQPLGVFYHKILYVGLPKHNRCCWHNPPFKHFRRRILPILDVFAHSPYCTRANALQTNSSCMKTHRKVFMALQKVVQ